MFNAKLAGSGLANRLAEREDTLHLAERDTVATNEISQEYKWRWVSRMLCLGVCFSVILTSVWKIT